MRHSTDQLQLWLNSLKVKTPILLTIYPKS